MKTFFVAAAFASTLVAAQQDNTAEAPIDGTIRLCEDNLDCTYFGDKNATCDADGLSCVCSNPDDKTELCSDSDGTGGVKEEELVVNHAYSVSCEEYFGYPQEKRDGFHDITKRAYASKGVNVVTAESCGSLNIIASGKMDATKLREIIDSVSIAQDKYIEDEKMSLVRQQVTVVLNGSSDCPVPQSPIATLTKIDGTCVATACVPGYELFSYENGTTSIPACKPVTTREGEDGDGLSDAAIAGIVIACVVFVVLVVFIALYCKIAGAKKEAAETKQADVEGDENNATNEPIVV